MTRTNLAMTQNARLGALGWRSRCITAMPSRSIRCLPVLGTIRRRCRYSPASCWRYLPSTPTHGPGFESQHFTDGIMARGRTVAGSSGRAVRQPGISSLSGRAHRRSMPLVNHYVARDGHRITSSACWISRGTGLGCAHRLLELPELTEDPRFSTVGCRAANSTALIALIDHAIARRDLEDWALVFKHYDLIWGPVPSSVGGRARSPDGFE